ncbi:efflux RND transporter periplasmic adaptor subunit [Pelagicoccus sp. SDUM812003]|uniref:efflux RND transporter periplasmic adaptor subunit n=1 Tax=Pelagicoccus sp. SDUM812003 TaxID=3041267 RepID=UPI00280EB8DF|nr:efflux RND transporter periplasmic adaptor subunit [Pelagicoccus sp. SDUM812003]MDQ8205125.1 efflux RND transporter periplasmic adaptor subunit [Pelagicoccus sp. SDUM812003]
MKKNVTIAATIVILLTAWMVVGSSLQGESASQSASSGAQSKPLPTVRVRDSVAEPYAAEIVLRGKTAPSKASILRAEIGAQIMEISAKRGTAVKAGTPLVRLDAQNLPEQLEAAEKLVSQRALEHEAAQKLQSSGYQSETRLAESAALLAQAKNQLASTRIALENTIIRAPYDGVFNERLVQVGEFVGVGDPVASFLALDPMIVTAEATELEIQKIDEDSPAVARFNGHQIEGRIRYLSMAADSAVRTYTVELEFANPDYKHQAGLTADIVATTATQMAHKVTPAILFLSADTDGELGLKTVDGDQRVHFYKTEIIGSASDGVWVNGLPEAVKLITVGQGFVLPGAKVKAVEESTIN